MVPEKPHAGWSGGGPPALQVILLTFRNSPGLLNRSCKTVYWKRFNRLVKVTILSTEIPLAMKNVSFCSPKSWMIPNQSWIQSFTYSKQAGSLVDLPDVVLDDSFTLLIKRQNSGTSVEGMTGNQVDQTVCLAWVKVKVWISGRAAQKLDQELFD